ncbi:MAG: hypothetical protein JNM39_09670 [Bdellovibrionaceae bacterium]|nr:hypothetical protein [Pseudobdellovibrionaceae bacterium]
MEQNTGKKTEKPLGSKNCSACGVQKALDAFYSKGSRTDSSCKVCILKKKRKSRKKQKAKSALLRSVRRHSKVLTFSEDQIEEKQSEGSNSNLQHLENLLRQFTFDSICRIGGKDEEK